MHTRLRFRSWPRAALVGVAALVAAGLAPAATAHAPAELVLTDARVYVATDAPFAEALAVRGGRLVYVGSAAGVKAWVGRGTRVERAGGRLVVPGLVDAHIHPIDIVDLDVCDLDSAAKSLRQLSAFVRACVDRYRPAPGQWMNVHQWNYTTGNEPDVEYPTLKVALDKAAPNNPVQVLGNDGHHGAYNSGALGLAKNGAGQVVGLTRATLTGDFAAFSKLVGVDERGEPNGAVNEDARYLLNPNAMLNTEIKSVLEQPERVTARLNRVGITAMMDAMVVPESLEVYDRLLASRKLTVRTTLAQFYDAARFHRADGSVDYDAMVAAATAVRAKYAHNPLINADTVKLFADGVLEGNPLAVPPTLPNAAVLQPLLQPIFAIDAAGHASVSGYVNTFSETCVAVRADPARYAGAAETAAFIKAEGYAPAQCQVSSGQLQHERPVILEFVRRFHLAGFNVHIHAIGDRAVRTAVDAIEAARAADGVLTTRDGLAHVQLAHPDDVARIGRDHLSIAYTYAWAATDPDYDLSVIPFLQKVSGSGYEALHAAGSYYEANAYPVRASKAAGALLVAGSDAPVETRDPRPFYNMAHAVSRRNGTAPALNPAQAISIEEALEAYTINGAKALGREQEIGSLEVGKSADFVVLDRDILALGKAGKLDEVAATKPISTWFRGKPVYRAVVLK